MTITTFGSFTDGLHPSKRHRDQFMAYTDLDDEKLWVPYVPNVWFQPCQFNVTTGGFANVLKVLPGARLPAHYHISTVYGYTLRGKWYYAEHDWVATPGSFIYEPAGEAHTLCVPEDATEPMMTFFVLSGGLIYVDNVENGNFVGYDDGFTLLELARKHYRETGLDMSILDNMIR
jgi:quercetin dioxygenase-like cupin family protein